jgi:antitoxin component of MazEF toxin-antitoxin module
MSAIKFKRQIRKSGGSASIALPPEILEALGWQIGDKVELWVENGSVVIGKTAQSS